MPAASSGLARPPDVRVARHADDEHRVRIRRRLDVVDDVGVEVRDRVADRRMQAGLFERWCGAYGAAGSSTHRRHACRPIAATATPLRSRARRAGSPANAALQLGRRVHHERTVLRDRLARAAAPATQQHARGSAAPAAAKRTPSPRRRWRGSPSAALDDASPPPPIADARRRRRRANALWPAGISASNVAAGRQRRCRATTARSSARVTAPAVPWPAPAMTRTRTAGRHRATAASRPAAMSR